MRSTLTRRCGSSRRSPGATRRTASPSTSARRTRARRTHMLTRIRREESGVALITALLVTMIVASLALVVAQLSIHNVGASNYDRKRVQSVNAGEAGVDATWNTLEQTQPQNLPWDAASHTSTFTGTLGTGPGTASYTSTVAYYDANQTQILTQPSQGNVPAYAEITSRGTTN